MSRSSSRLITSLFAAASCTLSFAQNAPTPPADAGKAGQPAPPTAPAPGAPAPGGPGGDAGDGQGGMRPGGFGRRGGFGPGGFGPGGGAPQAAEDTTFTIEGDQVALTFPNNAVTDLLSVYEKLTGMTLVKDTAIFDGSPISLVTPKPVEKAEAIRLIEATLLTNGYSITLDPSGKSARILPTRIQGAQQLQFSQGLKFYQDEKDLPEGETLVTYFMKLQHLLPEDAGTILGNHVGLNVYGRITPVSTPPGLLITETASIVRQLISIGKVIDNPTTSSSLITKFVKLEYADAAIVAQLIQSTLDALAKDKETKGITTIRGTAGPERRSSGSSNSPPPPPSSSSSSSSSSSNRSSNGNGGANEPPLPNSLVVADARLNQLLIVATAEDYAYITSLITELDKTVEVPEPYERKLNYAYCVDVLSACVDQLKEASASSSSQLPGGGSLNLQQQQPQLSSSTQLLSGRNSTNRRGGTAVGSTGASFSSDTSTGGGTSGAAGATRPDQLTAPQEDNAPISVLVKNTRIIADPPSNSIFVMGPKESVDKINSLLDKLDQKPAQVYLATIIGQLNLGNGSEFGVDWLSKFNQTGGNSGFTSSFFQKRTDVITGNNISDLRDNLITTAFGPASGFNLYGQITDTLDSYITALETTDRFKVLSRPSVFALNNKKATITSGQSIPVPSQSTTNLNNNGNTITTTVAYKDVVLKLEVVPLINPNNEVTLNIAQVNDTVVGTQRVEPNDVPIISTEQVITTVTVPSGNTVVLGGLISEQDKKNTGGVPLISRIPGVGSLFKNTTKSASRNELIIFIQPHVVEDDMSLRKWSTNEDIRTKVGGEAYERFPTEATPIPPATEPEKRKSWFKRIFDSDRERVRPGELHPLKRP